jgi:hypothetical protein
MQTVVTVNSIIFIVKANKHVNLIYLHTFTGLQKTLINIVQTVVTVNSIIITVKANKHVNLI